MVSSAVFNIIALGAQSVQGTPVDAAVIFPADAGVMPELDRATTSPEEDHGDISRHHAGRSYHGVRGAQLSIPAEARFEDIIELFEMHVAGGIVPTGGPNFTYVYDFDEDADTLTRYTIETGADAAQDQWQVSDCLVNELELGFDALTAPGASPWRVTASILGKDRVLTTLTPGVAAPVPLETMLGHHTALLEGSTATAFGSLAELEAHLAQFRLRSSLNLVRQPYGATDDDTFSEYTRGGGAVEFDAMVKVSATSKTNVHDIWNVDASLVTERRWRIQVDGSNSKSMTIDARVAFTAVQIGDRNGERVYAINGYFVKDPTLATRGRFTVVNQVAAHPSASGS